MIAASKPARRVWVRRAALVEESDPIERPATQGFDPGAPRLDLLPPVVQVAHRPHADPRRGGDLSSDSIEPVLVGRFADRGQQKLARRRESRVEPGGRDRHAVAVQGHGTRVVTKPALAVAATEV